MKSVMLVHLRELGKFRNRIVRRIYRLRKLREGVLIINLKIFTL